MRLNLYLSRSGVSSRRGADALVKRGRVRVNGHIAKEPFLRIGTDDVVKVDGKRVSPEKFRYILLNKPPGYTCTLRDRFAEKKITDLIPGSFGRLFPVGRLDRDSSGLIILTNDGDLANLVMHPRFGVEKEYRVEVTPVFDRRHKAALMRGIDEGGDTLKASGVRIVRDYESASLLSIIIKEGKKRELRRMFARLGYRVVSLERVRIGDIVLGGLKPGRYRELSEPEIDTFRKAGS